MTREREIELSHPDLAYALGGDRGLRLRRFGVPSGSSWLDERAKHPVFAVFAGGGRIDGTTEGLAVREVSSEDLGGGMGDGVWFGDLREEDSAIVLLA